MAKHVKYRIYQIEPPNTKVLSNILHYSTKFLSSSHIGMHLYIMIWLALFIFIFRDGYSCGWTFSLNPWAPQDRLSTLLHAKQRSRVKEPSFQILRYKIYCCARSQIYCSLVQVLFALHYLEHNWCYTRWCQCHRREDEWHLREGVRPC